MVKFNNSNYQRSNTERVRSVESDHIEVDYGSMRDVHYPKEERYSRTYYKEKNCRHETDSDAIEADHSSMTETTSESGVSDLDTTMTDTTRCKCCPYGYHIEVDFMEFLNSVEEERSWKNVTRGRRKRDDVKDEALNDNRRSCSLTMKNDDHYISKSFNYHELRNTLVELDKIVEKYIKDLEKHCRKESKQRSSSADLLKQRRSIDYNCGTTYERERTKSEKITQELLRTHSIPVSLNQLCTFQPKLEQRQQLSRVPPPIPLFDRYSKNHIFQKTNPLRVASPEVFVSSNKLPPLFISEAALGLTKEHEVKHKEIKPSIKVEMLSNSIEEDSRVCSERTSPAALKRTVGIEAEEIQKKTSGVECPRRECTRDVGILHRHKTPTREVGVLHKVEQSKVPTRDVAVVIRSKEIGKGMLVDERIEEIEGIYREKVKILEKQLEEKERRPTQRHVGLTHYPEVEDRALNTDNIRFGRDVALQYVHHPCTRDACTQFTTVIAPSYEQTRARVASRDFALNVNIPVKQRLRDVSTMVNFDRKAATRDVGLGVSSLMSDEMSNYLAASKPCYDACIDTSTLVGFRTTSTSTELCDASRSRKLKVSAIDRSTMTEASAYGLRRTKEFSMQVDLLSPLLSTKVSAGTQHTYPNVRDSFCATDTCSFKHRGTEVCISHGVDISSNTEKTLMCNKACSTNDSFDHLCDVCQRKKLHSRAESIFICNSIATQTAGLDDNTQPALQLQVEDKDKTLIAASDEEEFSSLTSQTEVMYVKTSDTMAVVGDLVESVHELDSQTAIENTDRVPKPVSGILKKSSAKYLEKNKKAIQFCETVKIGDSSETAETSSILRSSELQSEGPYSVSDYFESQQSTEENVDEFGDRSTLDEELYIACAILNQHLYEPKTTDKEKVQSALTVIQQDWFKASSRKDANPQVVEEYLIEFKNFSNFLLERIVNMADANGNTALHYSVSNGNWDIVNLLLDSGVCDVNLQNHSGYTASMLAAIIRIDSEEQHTTIKRLFTEGNVNVRATHSGQTALMLAVSHGITETTRLLLECGAQVNLRDIDGSTSLMCAVDHGHTEIVRLLLSRPECDVGVADNDGSTAMTIASQKNRKDILVLLYGHIREKKGHHPALARNSASHDSSD